MSNSTVLTKEDLRNFTGSEEFVRYNSFMILTEGVVYVAETAGAFWLLDIIMSYQTLTKIRKEPFQTYTLKVDLENQTGVVTCTDGNENILKTQKIPYTDFPLDEITIWYLDNQTVLLPSEY